MAWRNIWRSPWRSAVVIGSMALGVWAGIFMMGWATGLNDARTVSLLDDNVGHGRIQSVPFEESQEPSALLPRLAAVLEDLASDTSVTEVAPRLVVQAMIQSGSGAAPAMVLGVYPQVEPNVFKSARNITIGRFLEEGAADEIVLGEELAKRLEVGVDDRLVLTFQDLSGEVHSALFYVVGLYDGASNLLEETMLYVPALNIAQQMGMLDSTSMTRVFPVAHEVCFRVKDPYAVKPTMEHLRSQDSLRLLNVFRSSRIESLEQLKRDETRLVFKEWRSISPELGYADEIMAQSLLLFMTIILLAMAFGILNTMLMAILERTRELGMLMAVGMNKRRLFTLIVLETLLLSFAGLPIGLLLGHSTLAVTSQTGITLKGVEQGLAEFGMESTIYPVTVPEFYLPIAALVFVLAFLSALYPARKALKLNPIESMRVL
jgi:ABC-type lipoprotein release transport system permease subunit